MKKFSASNKYMATTNKVWFSVGGKNGVTYKLILLIKVFSLYIEIKIILYERGGNEVVVASC